jgi:hypothetical protein
MQLLIVFDSQCRHFFQYLRVFHAQRLQLFGPRESEPPLFGKLSVLFRGLLHGIGKLPVKLFVRRNRPLPGFLAMASLFRKLLFAVCLQMFALAPHRFPFGSDRFTLFGKLGFLCLPLVLQFSGNAPPLVVGFAPSGADCLAFVFDRMQLFLQALAKLRRVFAVGRQFFFRCRQDPLGLTQLHAGRVQLGRAFVQLALLLPQLFDDGLFLVFQSRLKCNQFRLPPIQLLGEVSQRLGFVGQCGALMLEFGQVHGRRGIIIAFLGRLAQTFQLLFEGGFQRPKLLALCRKQLLKPTALIAQRTDDHIGRPVGLGGVQTGHVHDAVVKSNSEGSAGEIRTTRRMAMHRKREVRPNLAIGHRTRPVKTTEHGRNVPDEGSGHRDWMTNFCPTSKPPVCGWGNWQGYSLRNRMDLNPGFLRQFRSVRIFGKLTYIALLCTDSVLIDPKFRVAIVVFQRIVFHGE